VKCKLLAKNVFNRAHETLNPVKDFWKCFMFLVIILHYFCSYCVYNEDAKFFGLFVYVEIGK